MVGSDLSPQFANAGPRHDLDPLTLLPLIAPVHEPRRAPSIAGQGTPAGQRSKPIRRHRAAGFDFHRQEG